MRPLPPLPLVKDNVLAPNGALIFDNSTLELLRCPRLLEYKWLRKRELVANKAGRNFGSTLHNGWAERYARCLANAPKPDDVIAINESMRKWLEENPQPSEDFRNFDHACKVMMEYNANYGNEPFRVLTNPKTNKPLVEASFCLDFDFEIDGHPVYYSGKIDTGIEDSNGVWSFDHKSAFQFGDTFTKQMQRDGGQMGYFWALWQVLGARPAGYVIDAVRIRKPSRSKAAEYGGTSGAPVDASDFQRIPFAVPTDQEVETWKSDVRALITLAVGFHKAGHFPEYRWQCVGKYGPCDMYECCSCPPDQRDGILYHTTLYEESTWSPLHQVNKES